MRRDGPLAVVVGDVVELRKAHPCGSREWTVTGLGADIRLRCNGCGRRIFMPRATLEKRIKRFVSRGPAMEIADAILAGETPDDATLEPQPDD